jgi:hypothetical protein
MDTIKTMKWTETILENDELDSPYCWTRLDTPFAIFLIEWEPDSNWFQIFKNDDLLHVIEDVDGLELAKRFVNEYMLRQIEPIWNFLKNEIKSK